MRWVMTLKDHATGLTYLCALPRKRPNLMAYKLQEICGLIGYPKIFHTDNGKEFTAKLNLRFLRDLNPNILAVTGRPRRPRDQGSVENANAMVKRVLGAVLAERRLAGDKPNWTEVFGSIAAVVNSQCGRGKYHVPAFEAVFGQVYDHPFYCSKEEARRCWTVKDRMKVTNDPDFEVYVNENYIIEDVDVGEEDDIDEIDESGYFSEEELSQEENEEVTDEYFHLHLYDDTELKSPPEDIAETNVETNVDLFDEVLMESLGEVNEIGSEALSSPNTFSPVETQQCLTGICFGPNCVERCFTHNIFCTAEEKKCDHQWTTIDINRTGEYVTFPSSIFH
jgi:transposase InsO family protein